MLLLGLLAVVPVVVALHVAARPTSERRVERFVARHRLPATADHRTEIVSYLTRARRHRTIGVLCGYVASVAMTLPQNRLAVEFGLLIAGWFGGAVIAELRPGAALGSRPGEPPVPGWLLRVPLVLAVVTVAVTVWLMAVAPERGLWWRIAAWGLGALACAVAVALSNRHALSRVRARTADAAAVTATAADSIGVITGIGALLAVICLTSQAGVIAERWFDHLATAMAGAGLLWAFGAILIAALLMSAAWPGAIGTSSGRGRPRTVLMVVGALAATSGGWLGYARWQDHPPYAAAAIGATATVRLTDDAQFDKDTRALGITGLDMLLDTPGAQNFVGRIDYTVPNDVEAGGYYHVIVLNRRDNRVAPLLFGTDGGGWDGFLDSLPKRYPWLSALTPVTDDDPYHDVWFRTEGQAVTAPADAAGPVLFVGSFPGTSRLTAEDVMVVLVYAGPDNQIYWATPVAMTA